LARGLAALAVEFPCPDGRIRSNHIEIPIWLINIVGYAGADVVGVGSIAYDGEAVIVDGRRIDLADANCVRGTVNRVRALARSLTAIRARALRRDKRDVACRVRDCTVVAIHAIVVGFRWLTTCITELHHGNFRAVAVCDDPEDDERGHEEVGCKCHDDDGRMKGNGKRSMLVLMLLLLEVL
jgi:hypothetical protein